MEDPSKKKDNRVLIFTILMLGALASVIALYRIALPFMDDHNNLNIAAIASIILITISYILAVKGGIPPPKPKSITKSVKDGNPTPPPKLKSKGIIGGIPPAKRKTGG